jgi:hypothetical protein
MSSYSSDLDFVGLQMSNKKEQQKEENRNLAMLIPLVDFCFSVHAPKPLISILNRLFTKEMQSYQLLLEKIDAMHTEVPQMTHMMNEQSTEKNVFIQHTPSPIDEEIGCWATAFLLLW